MRTMCHTVGPGDYNAQYYHQRVHKLAVQIKNVLETQLIITCKMIKCPKDLYKQSPKVLEQGKIKFE